MTIPTRRSALAVLILLAGFGSGCHDETVCTAMFVYGLSVHVTLPAGFRCKDVHVTVRDGDYEEVLETGGDCNFHGAGERTGTYDISAEGYGKHETLTSVVVADRGCHVGNEMRTITLTPDNLPITACGDEDAGSANDESDAGAPSCSGSTR